MGPMVLENIPVCKSRKQLICLVPSARWLWSFQTSHLQDAYFSRKTNKWMQSETLPILPRGGGPGQLVQDALQAGGGQRGMGGTFQSPRQGYF